MLTYETKIAELTAKIEALREERRYQKAIQTIFRITENTEFCILPEHHERFSYYHEPIQGSVFSCQFLWFSENADEATAIEAINRKWENMYFCEVVNVAWVVPLLEATKIYFSLREKYK